MTKLNVLRLAVCILFSTSIAKAQNFQITAYGGYTFEKELSSDNVKLTIVGHSQFGGTAGYEFPLGHNQSLVAELLYNMESTELKIKDESTGEKAEMPLGIQFAQIGARYVFNIDSSSFSPYLGVTFGASMYNPQQSYYSKSTGFGYTLRLGLQVRVSEPIYCFVQGQYVSASKPDFDPSDTENPSFKDVSMIGQIGVTFGIGFRFGNNVDY